MTAHLHLPDAELRSSHQPMSEGPREERRKEGGKEERGEEKRSRGEGKEGEGRRGTKGNNIYCIATICLPGPVLDISI